MLHFTDTQIAGSLSPSEAEACLADAFRAFGEDSAAVQPRVRTEAAGVKLSTMGAVIPNQGVVGAKVYTTIAGQFSFVILLFSSETGQPLATMEANAITAIRTPAASAIAARHLARADSNCLAVFGTGVQAQAHLRHFAASYPIKRAYIVSRSSDPSLAQNLSDELGFPIAFSSVESAAAEADILITATRSATPVLTAANLRPGQFVSAVGSSLPHTRELDDDALVRASTLAVDWAPQTTKEAGDIVLAAPEALDSLRLVDLKDLVAGTLPGRQTNDEITIFKSVGIGLLDIATAAAVWSKLAPAD